MPIHSRNPLDPVGGTETPQQVALGRRRWLQLAGYGTGTAVLTGLGFWGWQRWRGSDAEVIGTSDPVPQVSQDLHAFFPAPRDQQFTYGRPETDRAEAARFTNFYEFTSHKSNWRYVDDFHPLPWRLTVAGLCRNPGAWDLDAFLRQFDAAKCERQYRHRCVERWAMAIPWVGIPLAALLQAADPLPAATHVRFVSFHRPEEAPQQRLTEFPWPYVEGLTLAEAANELTLLAYGMYGEPLLKQHGAPLRLVVPWKYGFKSIKSIERIEFIDHEPKTFWTTLNGDAYPFQSNVEPHVPRPWPQDQERMLGTGEIYETRPYNGYADYVAKLYGA